MKNLLNMCILCIFIPSVYNSVYNMVREKESRMKETMRMMGMSDFAYWLSWYVFYSLKTTILSALATAIFAINCLEFSDPSLLFFAIFCYTQALFPQIVILQTFMNQSKGAGLLASLIYFALSLISSIVNIFNKSLKTNLVLSIIP